MPTYKIRGINLDFPFEAYDCQLVYMEKVIQSLQTRCNALLESPTGTGKTLCLLCATLAWRKSLGSFSTNQSEIRSHISGSQHSDGSLPQSQGSKLPTIIYTSRTHSQIRQVIQELKRTTYRPKMVVLGSREQLCIHEEVSLIRGKAQTNACHSLCKKRTKQYCAHFSRVAEFVKNNPGLGDDPIDIEDLVNIGRSCGPCPYYLSRDLHKAVDILFAPYNYLIDPGNRKSLNIEWNNSILIFDEAHNLEGLCADAASFDLPSSLLTACISEAKTCVDLSIARREKSSDKSSNPDNFAVLRALLLKLEKRISEVPIESKELGFTKPGPYIYELLADLNITQKTATMLIDITEEACLLLEEDTNVVDAGGSHKTKGTVCRLESMGDILRTIFRDGSNAHAKFYRVHIQEVEASAVDVFKGKSSRILSWWCFNPGIAMEEFSKRGVGSIILTSGTLSPLDSFAEELKLEFPVRLENPHVITGDQIWAGVVPVGPSGYSFNSSYRSRDSVEYKQELGNAIVNFARIVPDGLLVFFPSYYFLDQCISCWKTAGNVNLINSSTIWERICKFKLPVVEPRQSSLFPLAIEDYMTKIKVKSTSGAVFFAVCRGKVSEGLDFADHAGRAVVITGIPFATITDPKVRLKREYLDQQAQSQKIGCKGLYGEEWYTQQASRAVNQAVGRVIRHRHDYGAIIFCDERFTNSSRQSQISMWIQPHTKCYTKFGDVVYTLTRFFRDAGAGSPTKLEVAGAEDHETINRSKGSQLLNKLHLERHLAPMTTSMAATCSLKSVASSCQVKGDILSNMLTGILPANRSSLMSDKLVQDSALKCSTNLKHLDKKNLTTGLNSTLSNKQKIVKLTPEVSLDDKDNEPLAPYASKKRKLFIEGPDQRQLHKKSDEDSTYSAEQKSPQFSRTGSSQNHQATCNAVEKRGSAFLVQVREKLTDAEYKEFVGFMKALKSNALKIRHVLQSIAKLFSLPDRLSLLYGFKDYVPAKYKSLYERYLGANHEAKVPDNSIPREL
ncbi:unnamed protein product [Fraxinus pennsylvanica]|uniref:Regulator of telomere elongation helicase 1 homolog n=1 Tax=Fraxinus pennsylvanica TaxID=56036 RepID=A0AAD1ZPI9_9LAMI|nr:unnamed protein product [Fraxinus pennsylvanica]